MLFSAFLLCHTSSCMPALSPRMIKSHPFPEGRAGETHILIGQCSLSGIFIKLKKNLIKQKEEIGGNEIYLILSGVNWVGRS